MIQYLLGSVITIATFSAVVYAISLILTGYLGFQSTYAALIPLIILLIQYAIFPRFLDMKFSGLIWQPLEKAYPESVEIKQILKYKKTLPRIGILENKFPLILSYTGKGRNGSIIITSGLCSLLEKEEMKIILAHELFHFSRSDYIIPMITGFTPFILSIISHNILMIANKTEKMRGFKTLFPFGFILMGISKIFYFFTYFSSRGREERADLFACNIAKDNDEYITVLLKIEKAQSVSVTELKDIPHLFFALDFIGIINPWNALRKALNNKIQDHENETSKSYDENENPWNHYFELFSSHRPACRRIIKDRSKTPFGEKNGKVFIFQLFISMIPFLLTSAGILIFYYDAGFLGLPFFLLGLGSFIMMLFKYPLIRKNIKNPSSLFNMTIKSAIFGRPVTLKGKLFKHDLLLFLPNFCMIKTAEAEIPVKINSLIPGEFSLNEDLPELEIKGWLRKNPFINIDLSEIRHERKRIYKSYYLSIIYLLIYGIILFGIFLLSLKLKEG